MKRSPIALALLAAALAWPVAAQPAAPTSGSPPTPAANPSLPAAETLFENYIAAIGGEDAVRRHTSIKYVGTVKIPAANYSAFLTIWQAAPRSIAIHLEPPGLPRSMQYCDGERTWGYDAPPHGPGWRFFEGLQHDDLIFSADFYGDIDYKTRYEKIATIEKTDFNGRAAYKVFTRSPGGREQFIFFDVATNLILGTHTVQYQDGQLVPLIIINGDYKEVDGVRYISGATHRTPPRTPGAPSVDVIFTYRVIEPNAKDMPSLELPDELKAPTVAPGARLDPAPTPESSATIPTDSK